MDMPPVNLKPERRAELAEYAEDKTWKPLLTICLPSNWNGSGMSTRRP